MKRAKLKKKKKSYKYLFLIIIFVLSFSFTIKYLSKNININDKEVLDGVIDTSYNNNYTKIVNVVLKVFTKLDINNPNTFLMFNKEKNTSVKKKVIEEKYSMEDDYNPSDYEKITSYITVKEKVDNPILYIYNTHQLETYSSNNTNNMVPNVMMAGSLLSSKLNKNGISTLFEDTNIFDFISKMGLPKNELYGGSRVFVTNAKKNYPTLKYFIDLHRDSIDKDLSTININNKDYARVLFVLGTTNPNYEKNREMMASLNDIINSKYPNLSRGIYEVDIPDWPEIYNQDLDSNLILIELGAKDNEIYEVLNTVEVLSSSIKEYIEKSE